MSEIWMGKPVDKADQESMRLAISDKQRAVAEFESLSDEAKARLKDRLDLIMLASENQLALCRDNIELAQAAVVDMELAYHKGMNEGLMKAIANNNQTQAVQTLIATAQYHAPTASPPAVQEDFGEPWETYIPEFMAYKGELSKNTLSSYTEALNGFLAVIGSKPIKKVHFTDIQKYRDACFQSEDCRGGRENPAAATLEKKLGHINGFFKFCKFEKRVIDHNPCDDITLTDAQKRAGKSIPRLPYSEEDLEKIFEAPLYTGNLSQNRRFDAGSNIYKDDKFFLPLVALFTGARLNEIKQLRIQDIIERKGVKYFAITLAPSKDDDIPDSEIGFVERSLKTDSAQRIIPVHPILAKIGFLDYVERRKIAQKHYIFEPTYNYGKFWNEEFLVLIGIKNPSRVFHSFRHTFKRYIRAALNLETQNRLMGHKSGAVGEVYGGDLDKSEAELFIERFKLPVDLSHICDLPGQPIRMRAQLAQKKRKAP